MSDCNDVIEFSCLVSCLCPISFSKVSYPVRGRNCRHLRFFDRDSFLEVWLSVHLIIQLYRKKGGGLCPICSKYINVDDLIWDEYIQIQLDLSPPEAESRRTTCT